MLSSEPQGRPAVTETRVLTLVLVVLTGLTACKEDTDPCIATVSCDASFYVDNPEDLVAAQARSANAGDPEKRQGNRTTESRGVR